MNGPGRLGRLRAAMAEQALDAVAMVPGANLYYLTGAHFHLMERPTVLFVPRKGPLHAVIPLLERTKWQSVAPDVETIYWQDSDGYDDAFRALAARFAPARLGLEGQRMRVFEAEAIRSAFTGTTTLDAHAAIARMRLHKEADEVAALRRAIAISEAALTAALADAAAGMSETAFRQRLVVEMLERGADGLAFEPIVLSGGASASAVPTKKVRVMSAL